MYKMKLLLALFLIHISQIMATKQDCNVVEVNNKSFEKQVLKDRIEHAYQLSLDPQTNTIFFSYTAEVDSKTVQKIGYLNVATKEFGDISGVNGGMATGVDTTKHIVYFGGKDGLYTYDYATKTAKHLAVTTLSIWQMFYCPVHGLYFTTSDDEKPYVFKDGEVKALSQLNDTKTRLIAVGQHHDVYFENSSGVFTFNHHKNSVFDLGDYVVNGFTKDSSGQLYFSSPAGFYSVKEKDRKINKILSVSGEDTMWGAAFDKDNNIVYSNDNTIVKLVPTDKKC